MMTLVVSASCKKIKKYHSTWKLSAFHHFPRTSSLDTMMLNKWRETKNFQIMFVRCWRLAKFKSKHEFLIYKNLYVRMDICEEAFCDVVKNLDWKSCFSSHIHTRMSDDNVPIPWVNFQYFSNDDNVKRNLLVVTNGTKEFSVCSTSHSR